MPEVAQALRLYFTRWGLPARLRVDNGTPWGNWNDLATPFAAVAVTIVDVLLRGKEPTKEEVATVLMPSKELGEYQEQTEKKARRRTHARSN